MDSLSEDPLVVARVIGDVVDPFVPILDLAVFFGAVGVSTDTDINPSMCKHPPTILFNGIPDEFYTLIMTDPDSPDPSDPSEKEYIHWIVSNIPGGSDPIMGCEGLSYVPPQPKVGIHRYVLMLFEQKGPQKAEILKFSRVGFSTRRFADMNDLGLPVAAMYFRSQRD